jgi:hypothetical protein
LYGKDTETNKRKDKIMLLRTVNKNKKIETIRIAKLYIVVENGERHLYFETPKDNIGQGRTLPEASFVEWDVVDEN